MLLDDPVKEQDWQSVNGIQNKVDAVLQYLNSAFWISEKSWLLKDMHTLVYFDRDYLRGRASVVGEVAAVCRGSSDSPHDLTDRFLFLLGGLTLDKSTFDESAVEGLMGFFGKPFEAQYTGEQILELGFLPHSCTSFAILAFDILSRLGVKSDVVTVFVDEKKAGDHSVMRYMLEDGSMKKCDPKWQKHTLFFKDRPEELRKFVDDPTYFVHGVRIEGNEPLQYKGDKIIIRSNMPALYNRIPPCRSSTPRPIINFINHPLIFQSLNEAFLSQMEEKAPDALEVAAQESQEAQAHQKEKV